MSNFIHLKSISDLTHFLQLKHTQHPLVCIVDFSKVGEQLSADTKIKTDFYSIMFKNYCRQDIKYGRNTLDFQNGSLICMAPNQMISMEPDEGVRSDMMGWGLFFHPDLIRGSILGSKIQDYSFFSYEISEALHLSEKERDVLYDCVLKIRSELLENIDSYSQTLIVNNIELLLNYCTRYYGRQFITRQHFNRDVLRQVELILKDYFKSDSVKTNGIPSVKFLAEKVHFSPNYLSDLLKKETGYNAQDHIHFYLIEEAKNILMHSTSSVSEIAYSLGFEYPQYFSKLFKKKTGATPKEFRNLN